MKRNGRPSASASMWILLVNPPLERPRAWFWSPLVWHWRTVKNYSDHLHNNIHGHFEHHGRRIEHRTKQNTCGPLPGGVTRSSVSARIVAGYVATRIYRHAHCDGQ